MLSRVQAACPVFAYYPVWDYTEATTMDITHQLKEIHLILLYF